MTLLIPTFSPQGDGNSRISLAFSYELGIVDPYLFPARGRKLVLAEFPAAPDVRRLIPTFSPQGDGNNLEQNCMPLSTRSGLIPTFSPQGDGNICADLILTDRLPNR